jgi:threonyl-tRNA synthetase
MMRHSASHVMAEAVQQLFPDTKFAIGPAIENGFYYDFDLPRPLTPDDLAQIENKMNEIIAADKPFIRKEVTKAEAKGIFAGQPYKLELLEEIPESTVTVYQQGTFTDLCRGPHVSSSKEIKVFKLLNAAGAYWRGDEHRPMLQRIYGIAFETRKALADHLQMLEAGQRARPLQSTRGSRPRAGVLAPQRLGHTESHRGLLEGRARQARLRYGLHAAHRQD